MKKLDSIAVVVLTKGYDNLDYYQTLIDRNNSIFDTFADKTNKQLDFLIFHEGNIPQSHQDYISSKSKIPLIFKNVKEFSTKSAFDDSKNIMNFTLCPPTELSSRFTLGYKHMCHFWAIDLFDYLSDYEYVIRIDEDVIVHEFDPIVLDAVVENGIKFAVPFMCNSLDDINVIVGLKNLLDDFYDKNNFVPKTKFENIFSPNTNFMILNLEYFRNHNIVQSFLKEVDNSHGIYSNRWGDAVTWGVIVYALIEEPIYVLDMIEYYHGSHGHHINKKG